MNIVFCDRCKKNFIIDIETQDLGDNTERIYFTCPHCSKEYTSYYTNILIKKKQSKIREIQSDIRRFNVANPKKAQSLYKQYEKLKKELKRDMEKLRKRVESN